LFMSAQAKSAREAMKAKARRLASEPAGKVDASSYRISDDMHAEAKTGLRPVSKRAYKRGGAVAGEKAEVRADRKPRATKFYGGPAGGQMMPQQAMGQGLPAQAMGGMGGGMPAQQAMMNASPQAGLAGRFGQKNGGRSQRATGGKAIANDLVNRNVKSANEERDGVKHTGGLKSGGRAKKMSGGELGAMVDPRALAALRMKAADRAGVKPGRFDFTGTKAGVLGNLAGLKKGGPVEGSAKDMAEDKAMAKKRGMTMGQWEKSAADKKHDRPKRASGGKSDDQFPPERGDDRPPMPARDGSSAGSGNQKPVIDLSGKLGKYAKGGHVKNCGCPACSGGRVERASGGRTKAGKTNVNIIIATGGKPQGAPGDMMPPSMARPPGLPVAVPPPGAAAGAPPAMPVPMPMPMPPGAGGPPMARKSGGRTYRSYKDMDAGALGGKGRLEKTEIQAHKR